VIARPAAPPRNQGLRAALSVGFGQPEHLTPAKAHQRRGFRHLDPARSQSCNRLIRWISVRLIKITVIGPKLPNQTVESDISIWANGDFSIWRLHLPHNDRYGMLLPYEAKPLRGRCPLLAAERKTFALVEFFRF
jgi:hypothetical protein